MSGPRPNCASAFWSSRLGAGWGGLRRTWRSGRDRPLSADDGVARRTWSAESENVARNPQENGSRRSRPSRLVSVGATSDPAGCGFPTRALVSRRYGNRATASGVGSGGSRPLGTSRRGGAERREEAAERSETRSGRSCDRPHARSGRRDSNPRQPAWEAGTLPAELLPRSFVIFSIP